jgi:hypothetical protein
MGRRLGETCRRVGVWACGRVGVCKESSASWRLPGQYSHVQKQFYSPDAVTPTRRYADTLPQPTAHFERNDITIICETVR